MELPLEHQAILALVPVVTNKRNGGESGHIWGVQNRGFFNNLAFFLHFTFIFLEK